MLLLYKISNLTNAKIMKIMFTVDEEKLLMSLMPMNKELVKGNVPVGAEIDQQNLTEKQIYELQQ